MSLKTQVPQSQLRIPINFGVAQIKLLQNSKTIIIRALSIDWVKQMFVHAPQMGRRLWFEILSFVVPSPEPKSPLFEWKSSIPGKFYSLDMYEVDMLVTYADYLYMLDFVADQLEHEGYLVYRNFCVNQSFELDMMGDGEVVGKGTVAKPEAVERFADKIINYQNMLDETPISIFNMNFSKNKGLANGPDG
jgi:hypothetical protein